MSDNRNKSGVLTSLRGLKSILSSSQKEDEQSIPELSEEIPTLSEGIPVLDERFELQPQIKVSLDANETTETVEQQLQRTHRENPVESPELVEFLDQEEIAEDSLEKANEEIIEEPLLVVVSERVDVDENQIDTQLLQSTPTESTEPNEPNEPNDVMLEQQILDKTWQKVEALLMDQLPPELAGTFLTLLNDKVDDNRLQILSELSYLDETQMHDIINKL